MVANKTWDKEVIDECVKCIVCGKPLIMVFDDSVRDTCEPCGGHSKIAYEDPKERLHGTL